MTTSASPGAGGTVAAPYATQAAYSAAFYKAIDAEAAAKSPAEKREATVVREKVRQDGRASQKFWK